MARQETDREDLLREATALVERAELLVPGRREPVVVGFRRDGSFSVFFGGDPVYQFNTAGELRRAFVEGLLIKADQGRLASLRRERHDRETLLLRHDLSEAEQAQFLSAAARDLRELAHSLEQSSYQLVGAVPDGAGVLQRALTFLGSLPAIPIVAAAPHAR